jgi:hypothetical protein
LIAPSANQQLEAEGFHQRQCYLPFRVLQRLRSTILLCFPFLTLLQMLQTGLATTKSYLEQPQYGFDESKQQGLG